MAYCNSVCKCGEGCCRQDDHGGACDCQRENCSDGFANRVPTLETSTPNTKLLEELRGLRNAKFLSVEIAQKQEREKQALLFEQKRAERTATGRNDARLGLPGLITKLRLAAAEGKSDLRINLEGALDSTGPDERALRNFYVTAKNDRFRDLLIEQGLTATLHSVRDANSPSDPPGWTFQLDVKW